MKKALIPTVIFTILAVLTAGFRIYQSIFMIDSKTGFFFEEYANIESIYLIGIFGLIIAYFIIAMFTIKFHNLRNCQIKSKPLGILTLILMAFSVAQTVNYCSIISTDNIPSVVMTVIFIAQSLFLLYFGICLSTGKKPVAEIFLIPSIFAGVRFAVTFICYVDVIKVSDIILTITMLGFAMLFWHSFARVNSGLATKGTIKLMFASGFPAALLSLTCAVPKFFVLLFNIESGIHISEHVSVFDIASGIYIAVFLIMMLSAKIKVDERVVLAEKLQEENENGTVQP